MVSRLKFDAVSYHIISYLPIGSDTGHKLSENTIKAQSGQRSRDVAGT